MSKPLAKEYRAVVYLHSGQIYAKAFMTNKRRCIRYVRRHMRNAPAPQRYFARGEVWTSHNTVNVALLYQCHTDGNGALHVDEL